MNDIRIEIDKKTQWERKLLDLSLRNALISLRLTPRLVPIWTPSIAELEDEMANGRDYLIRSVPTEIVETTEIVEPTEIVETTEIVEPTEIVKPTEIVEPIDDREDMEEGMPEKSIATSYHDQFSQKTRHFDNICIPENQTESIKKDFKKGLLRSPYTETELETSLKNLYRAARSSIEENGANTLYLALGILKWYEEDENEQARYAPLILLPVELVRKSIKQGYILRLRDEDPQINVTILEKMKQDFGLQVEGLDPLPEDEYGIDTSKVVEILRESIAGEKRWEVMEAAYLGIFSFSQFVMWNDIRNRSEDLKQNKIVKSLMEGRLAWDAEPMEMGEKVSEEDVLLPIPADASQLFAIKEANEGKSFVLHGPPGTGKSQTITALIANAMAQGKTVLFVAEKMAALEVVQKRLANIGLDPFCLELHSNKAKKRMVLNQLQKAIDVKADKEDDLYESKLTQISALRQELDAYAKVLHEQKASGYSVYELLNLYEKYKDAEDIRPFSVSTLAYLSMEDVDGQRTLLERLVTAAQGVGHPAGHGLARVGQKQYSQQIRMNLEEYLKDYMEAVEELEKNYNQFISAQKDALHVEMNQEDVESQESESASVHGNPFNELKNTAKTANQLKETELQQVASDAEEIILWADLPAEWACQKNLPAFLAEIQKMLVHYQRAEEIKAQLSPYWEESFFTLDARGLLADIKANEKQWFLPKLFGENRLMKKIMPHCKGNVEKERIADHLQQLILYQNENQNVLNLYEIYGFGLEEYKWQELYQMLQKARKSQAGYELRSVAAGNASLKKQAVSLVEFLDELSGKQAGIYSLLELKDAKADEPWIPQEKKMLLSIQTHKLQLKEWVAWNLLAEEGRQKGLETVITAYEQGMDHNKIVPAYEKALSMGLLMQEIDSHPELGNFSGAVFNEKVNQLKNLDEEIQKLNQKEIFYRLAARVPNFTRESARSSEVGILQRAIKSGGRGMSLRKLFEQLPNLLPRLCPCMLMSPMSVAQYLATSREPFDLVVFDEASQLPTCKAVGALARGKEAIIVGDPKQMPPTSFFMSNYVDEEHLDMEDLESILDDCLALNMPQSYLLWHYRSRHESLIAFSNHEFYENKLYTFPSINDRESKVNLTKVDGIFDRGKTRQNRIEAEAVVEEIKRRAHDPALSSYSVGVVTFNINQQNLIDDLLLEACKNDPELESWMNREEEPLFIKNLENVQGDERDVILFSIGFGPDAEGKVGVNFGPLNRDGGWRRLNVAVTRARQEMKVFSSMSNDDIDLNRTNAVGVESLKAFLKFAEENSVQEENNYSGQINGQSVSLENSISENYFTNKDNDIHKDNVNNSKINKSNINKDKVNRVNIYDGKMKNPSVIADTICDMFEKEGYMTEQMVGDSQFHVDIAMIDPENEERYLLGILLDGDQYKQAKTTRDREIAQILVLEGLGWKTTRLWSMDWWDNPEKECQRILEVIEKILEERRLEREEEQRRLEIEEEEKRKQEESQEILEQEFPKEAKNEQEFPKEAKNEQESEVKCQEDAKKIQETGNCEIEDSETRVKNMETLGEETDTQKTNIYTITSIAYKPLIPDAFVSSMYNSVIRDAIESILSQEAPICENLLMKRVLQLFGISRSSSRIQTYLKKLLNGMELQTSLNDEKVIYWAKEQNPDSYENYRINGDEEAKRDITEVPWEESRNAILQILREQISLEEEDLLREAARLMGFARMTEKVHGNYTAALKQLITREVISKDRNGRWILTE